MAEAVEIKKNAQLEIAKAKQQLTQMTTERDGLKIKLSKFKNRKQVDVHSKFCINCQKDFSEKENFNWSCQVHRSEYGDHMWWCCGKRDINAPGCKFQKHNTREDNNQEDGDNNTGLRQIKCMCCKEYGHLAENCKKDPNLRTGAQDEQQEVDRIEAVKNEDKKFQSDSQQLTIKMLSEFAKFKEKQPEGGSVS